MILKQIEVEMGLNFSKLGPMIREGVHQACICVTDLDMAEQNAAESCELVSADCSFHVTMGLSGTKSIHSDSSSSYHYNYYL